MVTAKPYDRVKRVLDITVASVGLVVTAPVQGVIAATLLLRLGRPALFRQLRPGRDGVPFQLIKFRTMHNIDPGNGLLSDSQRMTRIGAALRALSLDELPTLWNVLRGDMSLVGPRPLLMEYLPRYTPEQMRRHEIRPGITGLAQISGRNLLTWEEKFNADLRYISDRSFTLDLRILGSTVRAVVRRDGISADGEATAPEFLGTTQCDEL